MINTSKFALRLQKIIDYYDETASSFAEKIGVQRSSISHILSGRNKPSLDFVMKILHTYPDVELYWLMNGKGDFPKNGSADEIQSELVKNSKSVADIHKKDSSIDKIIIFYKDGSFKSYENL